MPLSRKRVKSAIEFKSPTRSRTSIRASSNSDSVRGGGSATHENIALGTIRPPFTKRSFPFPRHGPPNPDEETPSSERSLVLASRRTAEIEGRTYTIRNGTAWHLEPRDDTGLHGLPLDSALHRSLVDIPPAAAAILTKPRTPPDCPPPGISQLFIPRSQLSLPLRILQLQERQQPSVNSNTAINTRAATKEINPLPHFHTNAGIITSELLGQTPTTPGQKKLKIRRGSLL
jgi:hypothetical protein